MSIPDADYDWRALSIKQPAASLIVDGYKTIENRSHRLFKHETMKGKWLMIHACKSSVESPAAIGAYPEEYKNTIYTTPNLLCKGKIIGVARIAGVYKKEELDDEHKVWANDGAACIYFDYVFKLPTPVEATGELGLWRMAMKQTWSAPKQKSKAETRMTENELSKWRHLQEAKYTMKRYDRSKNLVQILIQTVSVDIPEL
jgi:hypothetical protein